MCVPLYNIMSLVFDKYRSMVFPLFNISGVLSCSIRDVLLSWNGAFVEAKYIWFGC